MQSAKSTEFKIRSQKKRQMHQDLRKQFTDTLLLDQDLAPIEWYACVHESLSDLNLPPSKRVAIYLSQIHKYPHKALRMLQYARLYIIDPKEDEIIELLAEESYSELLLYALNSDDKEDSEAMLMEGVWSLSHVSSVKYFLNRISELKFDGKFGNLLTRLIEYDNLFIQNNALFSLNNFSSVRPDLILNSNYPLILLSLLSQPQININLLCTLVWGVHLLFRKSHECNFKLEEEIAEALVLQIKPLITTKSDRLQQDLMSSLKFFTKSPKRRLLFFLEKGFTKSVLEGLRNQDKLISLSALGIILNLSLGDFKQIEVSFTNNKTWFENEALFSILYEAFYNNSDIRARFLILQILYNIVLTSKVLARMFFFKGGAQFLREHMGQFSHMKVMKMGLRIVFSLADRHPTIIPQIIDSKLAHIAFDYVAQKIADPEYKESIVYALNTCASVLKYLDDKQDHRLDEFLEHIHFFKSLRDSEKSSVQVFELAGNVLLMFDPNYEVDYKAEDPDYDESSLIDI